jgi:hypothetical protein
VLPFIMLVGSDRARATDSIGSDRARANVPTVSDRARARARANVPIASDRARANVPIVLDRARARANFSIVFTVKTKSGTRAPVERSESDSPCSRYIWRDSLR